MARGVRRLDGARVELFKGKGDVVSVGFRHVGLGFDLERLSGLGVRWLSNNSKRSTGSAHVLGNRLTSFFVFSAHGMVHDSAFVVKSFNGMVVSFIFCEQIFYCFSTVSLLCHSMHWLEALSKSLSHRMHWLVNKGSAASIHWTLVSNGQVLACIADSIASLGWYH